MSNQGAIDADALVAWTRTYAGTLNARTSLAASANQQPGEHGPQDVTTRVAADLAAAWVRWHVAPGAGLFDEADWPWYVVLESARVAALASKDLPGVAHNLSAMVDADAVQREIPGWDGHAAMRPLRALTLGLLLAQEQTQQDPHGQRAAAGFTDGSKSRASGPWWQGLDDFRGRVARPWWKRFVAADEHQGGNPPDDAQIAACLYAARRHLHDGVAYASHVKPLVKQLAGSWLAQIPRSLMQSAYPTRVTPEKAEHHAADLVQHRHTASIESAVDTAENPGQKKPEMGVDPTQWDEEGPASQWVDARDAAQLHRLHQLDRRAAQQLAQRLLQRLQAAQLRHWQFDLDDGLLDSRRLSRLLGPQHPPLVFRQLGPALVPEGVVTLLVDQSGSMRGQRQLLAVAAIDLAVHALEACGVRCEVLGYTTRFGVHDNPIANAWQNSGRPAKPGRLNAVRHIIYKTHAQPWARVRSNLGLMLRDGFGRENLDDLSLRWAARRLLMQPEPRKILVVMGDAAPYDHVTAQANGREFLPQSLRAVISQLEQRTPIRLVALGTGATITRYYQHALIVPDVAQVPSTLLAHLGDLLAAPNRPDHHAAQRTLSHAQM